MQLRSQTDHGRRPAALLLYLGGRGHGSSALRGSASHTPSGDRVPILSWADSGVGEPDNPSKGFNTGPETKPKLGNVSITVLPSTDRN